jgi:hypothetical protein
MEKIHHQDTKDTKEHQVNFNFLSFLVKLGELCVLVVGCWAREALRRMRRGAIVTLIENPEVRA